MKRVVLFSAFATPYRSGAEACAEEVAARLQKDFDIIIVTSRLRRSLAKDDRLASGVRLLRVGFGCFLDPWLYPFLAPFAAKKFQPDLLHAVLESFAGLALVIAARVTPSARRLLTLQTTNRNFLRRFILRSPDVVTAISSVLVADAHRLGRSDVVRIPNGVSLDAIQTALTVHHKVPGRMLFVGRLERMKGVDTLLHAVADLRTMSGFGFLDWRLHIVGDGSQRRSLETLCADLGLAGHVRFLGKLSGIELLQQYAEAEIFVGLSRSEALGNVFLEAQAAECAVVATRVGGIVDVIDHDVNGKLVNPDDSHFVANVLNGLLRSSEERARLSHAAGEHAKAYDWSGVAAAYKLLYEALVKQ